MATSETERLLDLLDCMLATRAAADSFFASASEIEVTQPDEDRMLRSIARAHAVRMLLLEAQLAGLYDGPDRLVVEPY